MSKLMNDRWREVLNSELESDYYLQLNDFLLEERKNHIIYPADEHIFAAFELAPFDKVKVVLLGQDPYHGAGQAHGLCFSVPDEVKPPPSLVNIFREIESDTGIKIHGKGNLEKWAKQGVLLLNATLTVRAMQPGSHQKKGWETFTNHVIKTISDQKEGIIFILWGKYAQAKESLIDTQKHYVLKAAHPSPFSVYRGFYGCKHFSKTNDLLRQMGKKEIDWRL